MKQLSEEFKIKIAKEVNSFIRYELSKSKNTVILKQEDYIKKMLVHSNMDNAKLIKIPLLQGERIKIIRLKRTIILIGKW